MNILITGASGMLGANLVSKMQNKFNVFATGLSKDPGYRTNQYKQFNLSEQTYKVLSQWSTPDIIIHCAAITDVDYCEDNIDKAVSINGESAKKILDSFSNVKVIYLSTDAVFNNKKMVSEKDTPNPVNIYGKSKLIGENYITKNIKKHCIIRTTPVGINLNPSKQKFVEWIVNSLKNNKKIDLFKDVIFSPISVLRLVDEIEWIVENNISGLWHIAGNTQLNKYDFGIKLCEELNLNKELIQSSILESKNLKANRSKNQTMNCNKYQDYSGRVLPNISEIIRSLKFQLKDLNYV
mgnify:CR=1 FL=1|tara:strand:- start:3956 stop:4840 length:885 start_codon:yes stop_codon:yes gene_type:complete